MKNKCLKIAMTEENLRMGYYHRNMEVVSCVAYAMDNNSKKYRLTTIKYKISTGFPPNIACDIM